MKPRLPLLLALLFVVSSCTCSDGASPEDRPRWALVIHGGAGAARDPEQPDLEVRYRDSLTRALEAGRALLDRGGSSLDTVEQVVSILEDDPAFNAGKGAVFNRAGGHELDAAIMDGATAACGAVAGVTTVKNPIRLARKVMEQTRHVLLAGAGAERFARELGVDSVENSYFSTSRRREQWQHRLEAKPSKAGTVGAVALDARGDLAAATSTGGMTDKQFGRIGDSPIIGAGTYAKNATCAVSASGIGEEFIRHAVAHAISARMEHKGISLAQAAESVVHGVLKPGDGGIIAVGQDGSVVCSYSTESMLRAVADARGRFEVHVFD